MSEAHSGKISGDTRNNWLVFLFVSKCRKNVFRKQSTQNALLNALDEAKKWGYRFGVVGFGGTHIHFEVDVPSKYSVDSAEAFLKSFTARRIFAAKPNFRKLYPRGSFWSGYKHHYSFGADAEKSHAYVCNQADHHGFETIPDAPAVQLTLS